MHVFTLLTEGSGFVLSREHPHLRSTLQRMTSDNELVRVLRGAFIAPTDHRLTTRLRVVSALFPDAVVVGPAAAHVTFWPELGVTELEVARPITTRPRVVSPATHGPSIAYVHRRVPPHLVRVTDGMRVSDPALTALDLCVPLGPDAIDRVLRAGVTTVAALHAAFGATRHRRGNAERERHSLDSRGEPWSAAERLAHRILRAAGITGWTANHQVTAKFSLMVSRYYLDIAFPPELAGN